MSRKLERLFKDMAESIYSANNPIVMWSGGKDSTLLLRVIKDLGLKIPILCFHLFWTKAQKEYIIDLIKEWGLTPIFYNPIKITAFKNVLVADFNIGGKFTPVIMDSFYDKSRCGLDICNKILEKSYPQPEYLWDLTIVGSRESDTHHLLEVNNTKLKFTDTDSHRWSTPLWDWSDEEVFGAMEFLGVKLSRFYTENDDRYDTGNFYGCLNCVTKESSYCPKIGKNYDVDSTVR